MARRIEREIDELRGGKGKGKSQRKTKSWKQDSAAEFLVDE
jgi:hypothetical protein